jgi:hypothetical protein
MRCHGDARGGTGLVRSPAMGVPGQSHTTVAGTRFQLVAGQLEAATSGDPEAANGAHLGGDGGPEPLVVWKTEAMVRTWQRVFDELAPRRIFELGIANGGSTALLAAMAPDAKVVAIEISPDRIGPLDEHIARAGLEDRVRPHYGIDQSDRATLRDLVATEFGGEPIDLVIDDASHGIEPTLASLEALFPLVRTGGCYAIEDWAWGHLHATPGVDIDRWVPSGTPMSRLVFELMMVMGSDDDVIDRMDADPSTVRFWRGPTPIDPDTWSLSAARSMIRPISFD